jgi:hypothetical protein
MTETTRAFTVRSETDVLALVPYTFGFHPRESLVMLALTTSGRPFHARVDLPARLEDVGQVVDLLVQPAAANRAERVLLVAYTAVESLAAACLSALEEALDAEGVATLMTLRVDGDAWWHVGVDGDRGRARHHDVTAHALTSEGVLEGKVTYASREELRASVEVVDPDRAAALDAAHRRLPPLTRTQRTVLGSEGRWLLAQLAEHVAREDPFDPVTGARVVRALDVPALRDLAWCRTTRAEAPAHVRLWEPLVQGCPDHLVASPAAVLGFAAWLSGHGALAWCAVDRSLRTHPGHSLARLVSDLLDAALPPTRWEPVDPCALALTTR